MSLEVDQEWESWAADWRTGGQAVGDTTEVDVRRKVHRHSLGLVALTCFEVLLSIVTVVYFVRIAIRDGDAADVAIALAMVFLLAVLWVFALWNRRGTWRPTIESTAAFVELSYLRARRQLRTIRFMPYFIVFELLLVLPLILWRVLSDPERLDRLMDTLLFRCSFLGLFLTAVGFAMAWWRRRVLRELSELEELRDALET